MTSRRSFALNRNSVAASRQFVGDAVADLPKDVRDAAILMMSELATNAIVHAATGFEVVVDRSEDSLRVAVTDVGGGVPELQSPLSSEAHGRGLQIVQQLSDEWGMIDNDDHSSKTVWYTVRFDGMGGSEIEEAAARNVAGRRSTRRTGQRGHHRVKGGGEDLEGLLGAGEHGPRWNVGRRGSHRPARGMAGPPRGVGTAGIPQPAGFVQSSVFAVGRLRNHEAETANARSSPFVVACR